MESYRNDLSGHSLGSKRPNGNPEFDDPTISYSDEETNKSGLSTTWWIIIIVAVIIILVLVAVLIWWNVKGSNDSSNNTTTNNTPVVNPPRNLTEPTVFDILSGPQVNPDGINNPLIVKPSGFVINNPNVQSWFQGKMLDLAPPIIGYLTTIVDNINYGLCIKQIGKTYKIMLTEYSIADVNKSNAALCSIFRWNYKKVGDSVQTYLVANGPNNIGIKNVGVDKEGLPSANDNMEKDSFVPLMLLAHYDQRNTVVQYYLVDMAGNPVCFTQENAPLNTSKIQLGMINPAVFKEQYSKLPISFKLEERSHEPLKYDNLYVNTIDRNNQLRLNNPWTGRWITGSSMKQHQLNSEGLLPAVIVRLNGLDYSLSIDAEGIHTLKTINTLCLTPTDYSRIPTYIQDDTNHTKISIMAGMTKTEIRQGSTGILNVDPDQTSPQDNTLQVYEDTSDNSAGRLMILGKFQTPLLLVNGSGNDINEPGFVGIRVWNPEVYPKQKKLVLRYKMRPTGIEWTFWWMKCDYCSDAFIFNYDLDDNLGGNLDERKAGRCPNGRYQWTEDYGYGHKERHDDHNYVVTKGSGWGACLYCRCLCSLEMPGSCYNKEQGQMVPHNIWTGQYYSMELFEHEVDRNARSRTWHLCTKCGVLWRKDGTNNVCTDGQPHQEGQRYFMTSEKGQWDT